MVRFKRYRRYVQNGNVPFLSLTNANPYRRKWGFTGSKTTTACVVTKVCTHRISTTGSLTRCIVCFRMKLLCNDALMMGRS